MVATTIPSVMLVLTPSPELFLYSMTSSSNMPNIFLQQKMLFKWHHPTVTAVTDNYNNNSNSIKVLNFHLSAKKQKPTNETTYFVIDFFLFAEFPFN